MVSEESAQVYLDENRVVPGSLGPAPQLPTSRSRKLLQQILAAGPIFAGRKSDWRELRLPYFDDAFSSISDRPGFCPEIGPPSSKESGSSKDATHRISSADVDEAVLRSGFLKFFVAMLKNYRR